MSKSHKCHRVAVGVASGVLLPPNPRRQVLLISLPDASDASIGIGDDAVASQGIRLAAAAGCPLRLTREDLGDVISQEFRAISTAGCNVAILEISGE